MSRFYRNRFAGEERVVIRKHEEQTLQEWYVFFLNSLNGVLFCASTQGMKLSPGVAIKLKRMGYKKGFPDIQIMEPRGGWHGMFVEAKVKSYPSEEQKAWRAALLDRGYYAIIVPGRFGFAECQKYLEEETTKYLSGAIKRDLACAY